MLPRFQITQTILDRLKGVTETSNGWTARCPAHDDNNPSLSITECDNGVLLHDHAGCTNDKVMGAIRLELKDLFPKTADKPEKAKEVCAYDYQDESGSVLFQKVRYEPKDFKLRCPDPDHPGKMKWGIEKVSRVLYRLPNVIHGVNTGKPVFVVEGEKDADCLAKLGLTATTNFEGANKKRSNGSSGKWLPIYSDTLAGATVIVIADKDTPGRDHAADIAAKLQGKAASVKVIELPDTGGKTVKDSSDYFASGGNIGELQDLVDKAPEWRPTEHPIETEAAIEPKPITVASLLQDREFNPAIEPPPLRPIYTLAGIPISTPANLTTITSAIKTGKSAVIGAMAAAAMPHSKDADLLGFSSSNPDDRALLWFDSEQSPDDFWHCVNRALKRAGLVKPPQWLHAYCLTGVGCKRAWECVTEATNTATDRHAGVHSILIDGIADLVADVNDAQESNAFVAMLHDMAIQHDCPIIGVIHFNPGGEKSRGHLGSQVERKAETNLALDKDADETTVIYSTKNRRAGIPKSHGPRFAFSTKAGMHVTVESRQSAKDAEKRETLLELAETVFASHPAMRRFEIEATVKKLLTVSDKTAERKVTDMVCLAVIHKTFGGMYEISKQASTK